MRYYFEKGKLVWVAPGACKFSLEEVELLLPLLQDMRKGEYPPEPSESNYLGYKQSVIKHHHAYFEAACQVAAEIDRRLAKTHIDRYLVEKYYKLSGEVSPLENKDDEIIREIAAGIDMEPIDVRRRIRSAISYIASGPCPRWLNCIDCHKYQDCPNKKRRGVDYSYWRRYKRALYHKQQSKAGGYKTS